MNRTPQTSIARSRKLMYITIFIVLALAATLLGIYLVNKNASNRDLVIVDTNQENAKVIKDELNVDPIVLTDEDQAIDTTTATSPQNSAPQPTYDEYGPSTQKTRPNVHTIVLAVQGLYSGLLAKLRDAPESDWQKVADQYVVDNNVYFSPNFNYLSSDSLHLFPQAANVPIPEDFYINSAIVDPSNSRQIILQIFLKPDTNWSILVVVKMKGDGNFGTFEKLSIRPNRDPL